mmetsp:Transcript_39141/g.113089  ORF Transcript_39141/g.113089 Transcript_39141/m.113089 type:complete len:203 (-) Transcript_39141:613-1221(-)
MARSGAGRRAWRAPPGRGSWRPTTPPSPRPWRPCAPRRARRRRPRPCRVSTSRCTSPARAPDPPKSGPRSCGSGWPSSEPRWGMTWTSSGMPPWASAATGTSSASFWRAKAMSPPRRSCCDRRCGGGASGCRTGSSRTRTARSPSSLSSTLAPERCRCAATIASAAASLRWTAAWRPSNMGLCRRISSPIAWRPRSPSAPRV